jgi:hypothetical protein
MVYARFTQPDTMVPDPGDPQSLNRYSYAGNNPLRYTDPSGHMWVEDDDANPCRVVGGCQTVVTNGWIEKPDAVLVGVSMSANAGNMTAVVGNEILHNETTGDDTLFVYFGASKGVGTGGGASFSPYYGTANDVEDDNLNYSGMFAVLNATATDIIGSSASYSYYPLDNPLHPKDAHSTTMGPAFGEQVSVSVAMVEYVPIVTRHKNGSIEINVDDYFFNPKFGNNRRGVWGRTFRHTLEGKLLEHFWRESHAY